MLMISTQLCGVSFGFLLLFFTSEGRECLSLYLNLYPYSLYSGVHYTLQQYTTAQLDVFDIIRVVIRYIYIITIMLQYIIVRQSFIIVRSLPTIQLLLYRYHMVSYSHLKHSDSLTRVMQSYGAGMIDMVLYRGRRGQDSKCRKL
jgi:hypothetical protein